MVADRVRVYSRSAQPGMNILKHEREWLNMYRLGSKGYLWESDGMGAYTITEAEVGFTDGFWIFR